MNSLSELLEVVAIELDDLDSPWSLVGGLAVSVRTEPRFTRDIDIAVGVENDKSAENLVRKFVSIGFSVSMTLEQQLHNRLATVRLLPPDSIESGVLVDLLFASSGIELELAKAAERLSVFEGIEVPVAQTGHLISLKLLATNSDRPQDQTDLKNLLAVATPADVETARQSVKLIVDRNYNRGRPLAMNLEQLLEE